MKKFLSILLLIIVLLGFSLSSASDTENLSVTLKPGLNSFSTPAMVKSILFSNGGNNISFSTMENGKWIPVQIANNSVKIDIYPLNGYIIRNDNSKDVTMSIEYDTDNSNPLIFSKNLDAGWNFLGITKTDNPFDGIKNTEIMMKFDLTNGGDTNLIQMGVNYITAIRYMLSKSYAVFVNSSGGVYDGGSIDEDGESGEGDVVIVKPECNILLEPEIPTNGDVTLTITGSNISGYSWTGYSDYSSDNTKIVSSNEIYTGYVFANGQTGLCSITVSNIDRIRPEISIDDTFITVYETGSAFDSNTILKYKWVIDGEDCGEESNFGYLTGVLMPGLEYWSVEVMIDGLVDGDYYLCVFENAIHDRAGNGNKATRSDKITISNGGNDNKPECNILQNPTNSTTGNVTLTISGSSSVILYSWTGESVDDYSEDKNMIVSINGIYTGYVQDSNGLTGLCSVTVDNIDKDGPSIMFYPNGGNNVTGVIVSVSDANDLRSDSKIKYRWQNGSTCSVNRSSYTDLSITKDGDDKSGYALPSINSLDGEFYLCILKNTIFDILGNSNSTVRSDKFIFDVNDSGNECQEICENNDSECPVECRSGILSDNSKGNVSLLINNASTKSVYKGNFAVNKLMKIDSINVYGNSVIPEGDVLFLDLYFNGTKNLSFQLTGGDEENGINAKYYLSNEIIFGAGSDIPLEIKAKYIGSNEGVDYNYKFKLLGTGIEFYEINPQTISITVVGGDENGDDVSNEDFMDVYNRASEKGILNNQIITNTNLNKKITNIELISFIADYAENILDHEIDENKDCSFINTENLSDSDSSFLLKACQLGLIQPDDNMSYNNSRATMSMFATLLSRSLRNDEYDGENPYYQGHFDALKIAGIIAGTVSPDKNGLKGDILVALMNSEGKEEYRRVANSYDFLMNDFNSVGDVYQGINPGDRVIFVVRHSERIRNCGPEGGLTEYGVELARGVGENLQGAPFEDTSTDFYGSSIVKRTVQTSYYVGESRGSEVLEDVLNDDIWSSYEYVNHSPDIDSVVYGDYFKDRAINSNWDINHLYENNRDIVAKQSMYVVNKLCDLTNGHPFSWITSHDWFTLPITEWATNENISFSQSNDEWPNFMQGVAIIVHENGGWEIYPVMSLDSGKMRISDNPGCN